VTDRTGEIMKSKYVYYLARAIDAIDAGDLEKANRMLALAYRYLNC